MLFNSYAFILAFLPITLFLYYALQSFNRARIAQAVLVLCSWIFYGYFHYQYTIILIGSIVVNFCLSKRMTGQNKTFIKKLCLVVGLIFNLSIIFYFKYWNFFVENTNFLAGRELLRFRKILMPLGISFFTFQQISYVVDSYRGETKDHTFLEYALYVSYFPQLIAGPIVLHGEMIPQFRDPEKRKFDSAYFSRGLIWFTLGLFKKVLIADTLGRGVDWGFGTVDNLSSLEAVLVSLLYTFQIYFDFSGYCDMAAGIASMFHFDLPLNFNSPYKASSIIDFWQRWHITLNRFLKQYVYVPLGGNRKGTIKTCVHVMIVFLISGIWHGASWTFIIWGVIHGIANVLNRLFRKQWELFPRLVRQILTFCFVNFTWILFRAENLKTAGLFLRRIFTKNGIGLRQEFLNQLRLPEFTYIEEHISFLGEMVSKYPQIYVFVPLATVSVIVFFAKNCHEKELKRTIGSAIVVSMLLGWSVLSLSSLSSFLYFNF